MKIYIAATFARAPEMAAIADRLRERGHEVTSECWHDSTIEEQHQEYDEWMRGRHWDDEEAVTFDRWCAQNDARGVRQADMVVFKTDSDSAVYRSTGGRHFELGLAVGAGGKYLCLVGEPENVFHHVPIIRCYPDWNAFFAALPAYEHAHLATWALRQESLRGALA